MGIATVESRDSIQLFDNLNSATVFVSTLKENAFYSTLRTLAVTLHPRLYYSRNNPYSFVFVCAALYANF